MSDSTHTLTNEAPLLHIAVALALGILAARFLQGALPIAATTFALMSVAAMLAGGACYLRPSLHRGAFWCVLFGTATTGAALFNRDVSALRMPLPDKPGVFCGEVRQVVKLRDNGATIDVKLDKGTGAGRLVRLVMAGKSAQHLLPADSVAFETRLEMPSRIGNPHDFDYGTYLRQQGISATGYCNEASWRKINSTGTPDFPTRARRLRARLTAAYAHHLSGDARAVVSALTLGDKSLLDKDVRRLYSETGASHILALSGLHLGIIFGLYQFLLLGRLRRRGCFITASCIGIAALWVFVVVAGAPLSLVRAATMFSVMTGCRCLRRDSFSLNNLSLAALLILIASPQALFDVGFQLSFTAVFFIIVMRWRVWNRYDFTVWPPVLRHAYDFVTVSLSAQIGTMPLVAYYFHLIPIYSPIVNFVVIPAAYVLIGVSILFLSLPFARPLAAMVLTATVDAQHAVLDAVSRLPGAVINVWPTAAEVVATYLMFLFAYRFIHLRKMGYLRAFIACFAVLGAFAVAREITGRRVPQVWVYDVRRFPAVHFVAARNETYLWSNAPDSAAARLAYLEDDFWAGRRWQTPHKLYDSTFVNARILTLASETSGKTRYADAPALALFAGRRYALLCRPVKIHRARKPLPVDALIVSRGFRGRLDDVLRHYPTRHVVLDGTLSAFYRERYARVADSLGIKPWDVKSQGAVELTCIR